MVACGDQFKVRLDLAGDFKVVVKPDIVYFPHWDKDYLVKSSAMLLHTGFVTNPRQHLDIGRPLTANETFSLAYLNIGSDNLVTITHKQRFTADEQVDDHAREGIVSRQAEGRTMVTHVQCEHVILIPEDRGDFFPKTSCLTDAEFYIRRSK